MFKVAGVVIRCGFAGDGRDGRDPWAAGEGLGPLGFLMSACATLSGEPL